MNPITIREQPNGLLCVTIDNTPHHDLDEDEALLLISAEFKRSWDQGEKS